jgi:hypothetical protein
MYCGFLVWSLIAITVLNFELHNFSQKSRIWWKGRSVFIGRQMKKIDPEKSICQMERYRSIKYDKNLFKQEIWRERLSITIFLFAVSRLYVEGPFYEVFNWSVNSEEKILRLEERPKNKKKTFQWFHSNLRIHFWYDKIIENMLFYLWFNWLLYCIVNLLDQALLT